MKTKSTDETIEFETQIYYSKNITVLSMITSGLAFVLACFFLSIGMWIALVALPITLYTFYGFYTKYRTTEPVVVINAKGIKSLNEEFISWKNILKTRVKTNRLRKAKSNFLEIEYIKDQSQEHSKKKISISGLDTTPERIESLLQIYNERYTRLIDIA
jgi:uncharacterized membrane protein